MTTSTLFLLASSLLILLSATYAQIPNLPSIRQIAIFPDFMSVQESVDAYINLTEIFVGYNLSYTAFSPDGQNLVPPKVEEVLSSEPFKGQVLKVVTPLLENIFVNQISTKSAFATLKSNDQLSVLQVVSDPSGKLHFSVQDSGWKADEGVHCFDVANFVDNEIWVDCQSSGNQTNILYIFEFDKDFKVRLVEVIISECTVETPVTSSSYTRKLQLPVDLNISDTFRFYRFLSDLEKPMFQIDSYVYDWKTRKASKISSFNQQSYEGLSDFAVKFMIPFDEECILVKDRESVVTGKLEDPSSFTFPQSLGIGEIISVQALNQEELGYELIVTHKNSDGQHGTKIFGLYDSKEVIMLNFTGNNYPSLNGSFQHLDSSLIGNMFFVLGSDQENQQNYLTIYRGGHSYTWDFMDIYFHDKVKHPKLSTTDAWLCSAGQDYVILVSNDVVTLYYIAPQILALKYDFAEHDKILENLVVNVVSNLQGSSSTKSYPYQLLYYKPDSLAIERRYETPIISNIEYPNTTYKLHLTDYVYGPALDIKTQSSYPNLLVFNFEGRKVYLDKAPVIASMLKGPLGFIEMKLLQSSKASSGSTPYYKLFVQQANSDVLAMADCYMLSVQDVYTENAFECTDSPASLKVSTVKSITVGVDHFLVEDLTDVQNIKIFRSDLSNLVYDVSNDNEDTHCRQILDYFESGLGTSFLCVRKSSITRLPYGKASFNDASSAINLDRYNLTSIDQVRVNQNSLNALAIKSGFKIIFCNTRDQDEEEFQQLDFSKNFTDEAYNFIVFYGKLVAFSLSENKIFEVAVGLFNSVPEYRAVGLYSYTLEQSPNSWDYSKDSTLFLLAKDQTGSSVVLAFVFSTALINQLRSVIPITASNEGHIVKSTRFFETSLLFIIDMNDASKYSLIQIAYQPTIIISSSALQAQNYIEQFSVSLQIGSSVQQETTTLNILATLFITNTQKETAVVANSSLISLKEKPTTEPYCFNFDPYTLFSGTIFDLSVTGTSIAADYKSRVQLENVLNLNKDINLDVSTIIQTIITSKNAYLITKEKIYRIPNNLAPNMGESYITGSSDNWQQALISPKEEKIALLSPKNVDDKYTIIVYNTKESKAVSTSQAGSNVMMSFAGDDFLFTVSASLSPNFSEDDVFLSVYNAETLNVEKSFAYSDFITNGDVNFTNTHIVGIDGYYVDISNYNIIILDSSKGFVLLSSSSQEIICQKFNLTDLIKSDISDVAPVWSSFKLLETSINGSAIAYKVLVSASNYFSYKISLKRDLGGWSIEIISSVIPYFPYAGNTSIIAANSHYMVTYVDLPKTTTNMRREFLFFYDIESQSAKVKQLQGQYPLIQAFKRRDIPFSGSSPHSFTIGLFDSALYFIDNNNLTLQTFSIKDMDELCIRNITEYSRISFEVMNDLSTSRYTDDCGERWKADDKKQKDNDNREFNKTLLWIGLIVIIVIIIIVLVVSFVKHRRQSASSDLLANEEGVEI